MGEKSMTEDFINLTETNIADEHLCCIIRSRKPHPGVEAKRAWLADRIKEGHVFRKLQAKGCCFIEYAPLESAWTPVEGQNYLYLYCLWVDGAFKGKGYGKALMDYCIEDAKAKGKSGICMLGARKQKSWLSDQAFAKKYGFKTVDSTEDGYELLALSFDGTTPGFTEHARKQQIANQELTIYYTMQCPFILQKIEGIQKYCSDQGVKAVITAVNSLEKAKSLPCVFNNWGVFYKGKFETVNLLDAGAIERILKSRKS